MLKRILIALSLLTIALSAAAQELITVNRVDFTKTRNDWVQMSIDLTCRGNNPDPQARDPRFVEDIKVKVYLVYTIDQSAQQFDFYTAEAEILIMEQNDRNNLYFYMPGPIVKRDSLRPEPDYYFVEVSVGGEPLPAQRNARSSSIANESILDSMRTRANAEASENDSVLMPIYFAPAEVLGRVDRLPILLRRDVRK